MIDAVSFPLMANRPSDGGHLSPFLSLHGQGVRLFHVDATCAEDIFHPQLRAWVGPEKFDYSAQDAYWQTLAARCPEARFCLRVFVGSPPWWDAAHPDELQRYSDGRTEHSFQRTQRTTLPSLASEAWQRDAARSLERFIDWLENSGWAEKVWGLFLCYGITWEWGILGSDDFLDYSEPMRRRFRRALRDTYRTNAALREAWGDPAISLDSAEVPSREARLRGDGDLRVFPRDRAAFDFQRCLSEANVDNLLGLAQTVRTKAGKRYKLGAFYGYTLTAREHSDFMGRYGAGVLASGLFDFLGSPYNYVNRNLDDGLLIEHVPTRSVQEHGIHVYAENDLWTFGCPPAFEAKISVGYTRTREDSIMHQRLALAGALTRGTSYWWTELTEWIGPYVENYSDPALLAELGRHQRLFEKAAGQMALRSQRRCQIALILDEEAIDALALESKLFLREVYEQLPAWAWCGAPFDVWLASDAAATDMSAYRLVYVFAPYLKEPRRTELARSICNSNRTVWWAPYTGWVSDRGGDAVSFEALTGFADPVPQRGQPQRRLRKGWCSLYGACAGLTAPQLAQIAGQAGVHLYGEPPIQVMASEEMVAVHVASAGNYALRLPQPGKWRDLFSGKTTEGGAFDFSEGGVALFARDGFQPSGPGA